MTFLLSSIWLTLTVLVLTLLVNENLTVLCDSTENLTVLNRDHKMCINPEPRQHPELNEIKNNHYEYLTSHHVLILFLIFCITKMQRYFSTADMWSLLRYLNKKQDFLRSFFGICNPEFLIYQFDTKDTLGKKAISIWLHNIFAH